MPRAMSRLGVFVRANDVKPGELANLAGVSQQHLYRLRHGLMEPTRPVMIWLTLACRRLLQREVLATELFDFGDEQ
jgi:predicted transcriptional regulator